MNKFVIGDIHGHHAELLDVLTVSEIDSDNDMLICLGDVCDRGPKVLECIQTLSKFKNLIYILGNHDQWTLMYLNGEFNPASNSRSSFQEYHSWLSQGGQKTINSIMNDKEFVLNFLGKSKKYFVDNYKLFVHGGIFPDTKAENNPDYMLLWDRNMVSSARYAGTFEDKIVTHYDEVFCGHTPTQAYNSTLPLKLSNVWMMDTGMAYNGKISIMNVDSKVFWQNS